MEPTQLSPVYVDEQPVEDTGVTLGTPAQDPDTGVSLAGPGPVPVTLSEPKAAQRAIKIQEGVGEHLQRSTEDIKQEIMQGRENAMRQQAASRMSEMNYRQKMQTVIDLAGKGGPLNDAEIARIMDPFNPENRPVNPDSVVERQYGMKYIGTLQEAIKAVPNTPIADATNEIPEVVNEAYLKGSVLAAKMEFAKKLREDMETKVGEQSYVGVAVDALKQMWQPYTEAKMRGLTEGVGYLAGVDIGSHLQETADKVFSLPFDEYAKEARRITNGIAEGNPQLAHRFAEYLEGLSSTDRILDGAFTYMLPIDVASFGKIGLAIARKISLANRTNKAVRDFTKAAEKVGTDKVARAEAAGDVGTATELKSTDLILKDMNGQSDPIKIATDDTLLTIFNQGKKDIASNPGNLTNTGVTKIQDAYDASGQTLLQRIVDAVRINRTPMAVATQNAVRIVKEAVKEYYPGIRNAILDISNPLYEPKSNTYWHEITFGNIGGDLFSNAKTAENFAKLHGLDARFVETYGKLTSAETEKMLERRAQIDNIVKNAEADIETYKKRADNLALSLDERRIAKEHAEGLPEHLRKLRKEYDDLGLKLKGKDTYDRVKKLQSELDLLKLANKEARDSAKKAGLVGNAAQAVEDAVRLNKVQMRVKAQEIQALKDNKAEVIGPRDTIEQHGVGFKIIVRRPLVETDKAIRDLMIRDASGKLIPEAISTGSQTGFKSLFNAALGKFRGADDTLALNESIQRKIGTYTQSIFKEWASKEAAYIKQIASGVIRYDPVTGETIPYWKAKPIAIAKKLTGETRKLYNDFVRTLDHARDAHDPDTGETGYFFRTPGELQNHYWKVFDRAPSFAEHEAYFAFVRMVEGDRVWREISEFRNRARLGTEQHSLSVRGPDGKIIKSDFFDGISMKVFPGGDDVMLIMSKKLGEERLVNLGGAGIAPRQLAEYKKMVEEGRLRAIRIYAPEHKPLRDFSDIAGNEHVRYVLTDAVDSKPIEFNHVNRRGGGHFEYDYDFFLKQPSMYHQYESGMKGRYRSVYTGDTTFMPLLNRVMGRDIANKMHEIQRLLKAGDVEGAKRWAEAHLPIEWDKLHGMFKPSRDAKGRERPPMLNLEENFVVTPRGKSVLDTDKSLALKYGTAFKDSAKSGSDNKVFQVAFNTERESSGLSHLEDIGTQGNPLYKYSPESRMIDPITTMNRSLNRIVNSAFMDDYKMYAVEHWLREAEGHLKASESETHSAPFWHFQRSTDKSAFLPATSPDVVRNLLSNRYKINQFVGVPSSFDTAVHTAKQWLVDAAYQKFGPEASRSIGAKALTLIPNWMLAHVHDPVTLLRTMTFHEKLGLFAVPQLLVQAQTFATILSISPLHGTAGTYAALLHQWSRINKSPEFLATLDRYATKLNVFGQSKWRPGELQEAMRTLDATGFEKVAGEYANLNTALKTDFVGNDFKSFLNAGLWFFREGEKSTRLGAWYTAFREFREVNPVGALSRDDIGKILQRADLLTVNMSRASSSMLNSGVFSLTTQFLNYQIRLAELFVGSRTSPMAKARMFLFYSALYGAPSAVGLSGIPLSNSIREEAIKRGYVPGENWIKTAVDLGIPAIIGAMITGDARQTPNFGDRLGSPGFTQFSDALKSDHPWYQLLAGASGTTLIDQLTASNNFFRSVASFLQPTNKGKVFPPKLDDIIDIAKTATSVNQGWKLFVAINSGKWMSKNEAYIGDVSKAGALFFALTGTQPQAQDDAYLKASIKKEEVAFQKHMMKEAIKEYRRYIVAVKDNDQKGAAAYAARADAILEVGGFPVDKKATVLSIAARGYETQIKSQDYDFAFKDVPRSRSDFMGIPMPFTTQSNIPETRREQFKTQEKLSKGQ